MTILFGAVMLLMTVVFILDARAAQEDPQTYEMVHRISVEQYIKSSYWWAAIFAACVALSAMPFVDKNRAPYWQAAVYVAAFVLVVSMIYGFGQWAATGFDH